ncbi:MAG: hypothetical protein B1H03_03215 [Planctomycetales bacterium 4484_113]|nr:MAG: hypothetical protein B1H03_03215 [Planctomycetales bacterium 4484_113]
MDPLRSVIFVDGRNLWYNLREFRFQTESGKEVGRDYRLDEKHFCWGPFFAGVLQKFDELAGVNHRLLRAYWYNVESLTRFTRWDEGAVRILERHRAEYPELTEERIHELAEDWHRRQAENLRKARDEVYEEIQRKTNFLEFKYVGLAFVNAYNVSRLSTSGEGELQYAGTWKGEKGVDTGMAVDMVSKMKEYDVAILVSGDADFIPVVRYLKDNLKQVYQFSLARGVPPRITYLSAWLRSIVDVFAYFDEVELLSKYLDSKFRFPPEVRQAIESRIAELKG